MRVIFIQVLQVEYWGRTFRIMHHSVILFSVIRHNDFLFLKKNFLFHKMWIRANSEEDIRRNSVFMIVNKRRVKRRIIFVMTIFVLTLLNCFHNLFFFLFYQFLSYIFNYNYGWKVCVRWNPCCIQGISCWLQGSYWCVKGNSCCLQRSYWHVQLNSCWTTCSSRKEHLFTGL